MKVLRGLNKAHVPHVALGGVLKRLQGENQSLDTLVNMPNPALTPREQTLSRDEVATTTTPPPIPTAPMRINATQRLFKNLILDASKKRLERYSPNKLVE